MENTQEKAQYFAQYYGQEVFMAQSIQTSPIFAKPTDANCSGSFLELKPLSSITAEDAIEVARIALEKDTDWKPLEIQKWDWCTNIIVNREPDLSREGVNIEMYIRLHFDRDDIEFKWDYNSDKGTGISERHMPNALAVFDFLRSKGYALPFRNYSVDQLQEMGWLKLSTQQH